MTPENFCYWLQGIFEVVDLKTLNEKQIKMIKNHLALVFTNVTNDQSKMDEVKLKKEFKDIDKDIRKFNLGCSHNRKYC